MKTFFIKKFLRFNNSTLISAGFVFQIDISIGPESGSIQQFTYIMLE